MATRASETPVALRIVGWLMGSLGVLALTLLPLFLAFGDPDRLGPEGQRPLLIWVWMCSGVAAVVGGRDLERRRARGRWLCTLVLTLYLADGLADFAARRFSAPAVTKVVATVVVLYLINVRYAINVRHASLLRHPEG